MTTYLAPFTENTSVNIADIERAGLAALPSPPDGIWFTSAPALGVLYKTIVLTAPQITAFQNAVANATADPNAPWRVQNADAARLAGVPAILRSQATAASGLTVTSGNVVAVTQTVVNDLVIFCNRLADLIEGLGLG